jgi:hypothetical protein
MLLRERAAKAPVPAPAAGVALVVADGRELAFRLTPLFPVLAVTHRVSVAHSRPPQAADRWPARPLEEGILTTAGSA